MQYFINSACSIVMKRGPKPKGERTVVYYRRVNPELVAQLEAVRKGQPSWENRPFTKENLRALEPHATNQIKLLLDDIERLTKEVEEWKVKHGNAVNATQDQLAIYWKRRALIAEGALKKGEYDQT